MAHVLLKAGPCWASEERNVEQKGKVSLIVQDINPNQLWEGILTSERVETDKRMGDRTGWNQHTQDSSLSTRFSLIGSSFMLCTLILLASELEMI